jgi:hypothetical protein
LEAKAEARTRVMDLVIDDLDLEVRRLNVVDEPLLYRIGVAGLVARHGRDAVRAAFMRAAAEIGAASIASATRWRESRGAPRLKVG